jgi:tripartite-type tricarboxylate transporter receptor subunit TctC
VNYCDLSWHVAEENSLEGGMRGLLDCRAAGGPPKGLAVAIEMVRRDRQPRNATTRRGLLLATPALLLAPSLARAQGSYPDRAITMVVPFAPGGVTDIAGRIVAKGLEPRLGKPVVVENRGGAGGNIGMEYVARAAPDGYTMIFGTQGTMSCNQFLYANIGFDVRRDFSQVGLTFLTDHILVVGPRLSQVTTVAELIALAKAKPGELMYGSAGVGGGSHLFMEYFLNVTGTRMTHVPYRGTGPAVTDLISGNLDLMMDSLPSSIGMIDAGKTRPLAVGGSRRNPRVPDVPTMVEAGVPGYEAAAWGSLAVPKNTPRPIVDKLTAALRDTLNDAETKAALADKGASGLPSTAAEADARVVSEMERWGKVIREANITAS